jgi:hypothetical protein
MAFSFCATEELCTKIKNLTGHPALAMPIPEIKILDIKQEKENNLPLPPPPPPPPPPQKNYCKKKRVNVNCSLPVSTDKFRYFDS